MGLPSSKSEAGRLGVGKYLTGRPCKHGHVSPRYALNGACTTCTVKAAEASGKVNAKWRRDYYFRRYRERYPCVMLRAARHRAKKAGVPFDITLEDVVAAWPEDGLCPVFGIPLQIGEGGAADSSPSLDRKVPTEGYVCGNIVVVSQRANALKRDVTDPRVFRRLADWMENNLRATDVQPTA